MLVKCFFKFEKELENSNQIIKGYENYIGVNEFKNDILDKVRGDKVRDICSEKDEVYKNNSVNRFIKIPRNIKREIQTTKYLLLKKYQ